MKNRKSGFTLSEVLISFAIIGVIIAFTMPAFKTAKASYAATGYFAYKNLQSMVINLFSEDLLSENGGSSDDLTQDYSPLIRCAYTYKSSSSATANDSIGYKYLLRPDEVGDPNNDMVYICPGYEDDDLLNDTDKYETFFDTSVNTKTDVSNTATVPESTSMFCRSLAEMANTVQSDCSSLYSISNSSYMISNFEPDESTPNIITTNGYRFFIAPFNKNSDYGWTVAIDLNGKDKKPNKLDTGNTSGNIPPDTVQFAVFSSGQIFPLGVLADGFYYTSTKRTIRYINAAIKVSQSDSTDENLARGKVYLDGTDYSTTPVTMDYRTAYCTSKQASEYSEYSSYCNSSVSEVCPGGGGEDTYDSCTLDLIKPLFRYGL
ncbi:MAG: type II secretion system protein [Candidatus Gastranaerophilales bacterium]|nr:type II secretion system protein [Candidatus Gastranaerophilales bacterium]